MDLYVIRHADALALGEGGVTKDSERPLSEKGEQQAAAVGRMLRQHGILLDRLVASPYLRAQQTAKLLREQIPNPPELLTSDTLVPEAKPKLLAEYLQTLEGKCIGVVGHLPHVAEWTGWLIGEKKVQLHFAKAGVAYIELGKQADKGLGALRWLVTPEWFAE